MKRFCVVSGEPMAVEVICPHCHEASHLELALKRRAGLATQMMLLNPELPGLWLNLFLSQHLTSTERQALFRSCKGLANIVVKHCDKVTLQPAVCLRAKGQQHARAFVLGLAAGSKNIHLRMEKKEVVLDTPAIWPCITQITLCDVGLNRCTISKLRFSKLTRLASMQLELPAKRSRSYVNVLNADALDSLRSAKQAGALPLLRSLHGDYTILCMLSPVLGAQVTQLVLHQCHTLAQFSRHWPALLQLEIQHVPQCTADYINVQEQLFSHPTLRHVKLPGLLLTYCEDSVSDPTVWPSWDSLEFTRDITLSLLSHFPLEGVQQLRLPEVMNFDSVEDYTQLTAALNTLSSSSTIALPAARWADICKISSSASCNLETFNLPFYPALVGCLFAKCTQLPAALLLRGCLKEWDNRELTCSPHLGVLSQLPGTIHTLYCFSWALGDGCSWTDVITSIPSHVRHLLIRCCVLMRTDWDAMLNQPAPPGLRVLTLARDSDKLSWVPWDGDELDAMQAKVSAKWPLVRLELDDLLDEGDRERNANAWDNDNTDSYIGSSEDD